MLRDEDGMLSGYVYIDLAGRDVGGYVEDAKKAVQENLTLPTGYSIIWSGQYENMQRIRERLKIVLPMTLFLICILLYMNTKSAVKTAIIMLAVPFSLVGAVWYLWFLGYHMSIAVWVGMIALMGLDAETGVFMLLFLDLSYNDALRKGKMQTSDDLREAIIHGAVKRVRPKSHDRHGRDDGINADHVVDGHRRRHDETHRRAHDRRPGHQLHHGTARLSGNLCHLERQVPARGLALPIGLTPAATYNLPATTKTFQRKPHTISISNLRYYYIIYHGNHTC